MIVHGPLSRSRASQKQTEKARGLSDPLQAESSAAPIRFEKRRAVQRTKWKGAPPFFWFVFFRANKENEQESLFSQGPPAEVGGWILSRSNISDHPDLMPKLAPKPILVHNDARQSIKCLFKPDRRRPRLESQTFCGRDYGRDVVPRSPALREANRRNLVWRRGLARGVHTLRMSL